MPDVDGAVPEVAEKTELGPNQFVVNAPKAGPTATFIADKDFGETLADAEASFGAEVVLNFFTRTAVIALQNLIRKCLEDGGTDTDCQAVVDQYVPGVAAARGFKNAKDTSIAYFKNLSSDERKEFLAGLKDL